MKQKQISLIWLPISWAAAVFVRIWNLSAGYDADGLPISGHISTWCLAGFSALVLVTYLLLSLRLRGSGSISDFDFGLKSSISAYAGAVLLLAGSVAEYTTSDTNAIVAMILLICGLLAGLSMVLLAGSHRSGKPANRIAELIPICYLLIKLIINFKSWSIDPIILDYCIRLFAMICILLSFYYAAGFTFRIPAPARCCFFTAAGVFFAAAAIGEAAIGHDISDLLFYSGCFLWLLPVLPQVLKASNA